MTDTTDPVGDDVIDADQWARLWTEFTGACRRLRDLHGIGPEELHDLIGSSASGLVDALGTPAITSVHQMLIYFASSDEAHRAASFQWQKVHQAELIELQRDNPDIRLLERAGNA
jgi:hypothetical protein